MFKIPLPKKGFTFIELMIVTAIMAVLIAVAIPTFRDTFGDLELKDAAYNVSKLIQYAQHRAVIEERKYRLAFNFEDNSYYLIKENRQDEINEAAGESGMEFGWQRTKGRFGRHFYIPEDIEIKGEENKITFFPNGRCGIISIYLTNQKNKTLQISTNGRIGFVSTKEIEKE